MTTAAEVTLFRAHKNNQFLDILDQYVGLERLSKMKPVVRLCFADALYETGDYLKAVDEYSAILRKRMSKELRQTTRFNRAMAYWESDHLEKAIVDFRALPLRYGKTEEMLGRLYYYCADEQKHPTYQQRALKHLSAWARRNPDDGEAFYLLSLCYNQLGNAKRQLETILRSISLGYLNEEVVECLINALSATKTPQEIERYIPKVVNLKNDPDGIFHDLAIVEIRKLIK
jgi:tetratricopeptide (TPR) repeat protein